MLKKLLLYLLLTFSFVTIGYTGSYYPNKSDIGQWRWNTEQLILEHDKEAHAAASAYIYTTFRYGGYSQWDSFKYTFVLGLIKESSDALLPYEEVGAIGGDGFSFADICANMIGIGASYLITEYIIPASENL